MAVNVDANGHRVGESHAELFSKNTELNGEDARFTQYFRGILRVPTTPQTRRLLWEETEVRKFNGLEAQDAKILVKNFSTKAIFQGSSTART